MPARKQLFILIFLLLFFILFPPKTVLAQVILNEFSPLTSNDWVEVYNDSSQAVELSQYYLFDEAGNQKGFPSCLLNPGGAYAIDWSNKLNNDGDKIILKKDDQEIDCVAYKSGPACAGGEVDLPDWSEGEYGTRQENGSGSWQVLPTHSRADNSQCVVESTPTVTPTSTEGGEVKDYDDIFIVEFMADPESGDEWVELYNNNSSQVDLHGWAIDDKAAGGESPRSISGTIEANGYKQFDLGTDRFLNNNNDGDDVRLLNGAGEQKDKTSYGSATKGKSWSKDSSGNWCQVEPTPNAANPSCGSSGELESTSTPTASPTPTPKVTPSVTPTEAATGSGEILGQEATDSAFHPWQIDLGETGGIETTGSAKKKTLAKILFTLGLLVLFGAGFSLWYTQLRDQGGKKVSQPRKDEDTETDF